MLSFRKTICLVTFFVSSVFSFAFAQHEGLDWFANGERHKQQARYDLALQEYDKAIKREPRNHLYLYSKAECEYQLRKSPDAIKSLSFVLRLNSSYAPAYALLAKIYNDQENQQKASQLYDIAAKYEVNKEKKEGYRFFVIKYHLSKKSWVTAYEKIKLTKNEFPQNLELYYLEAQVANYLSKHGEAVKSIQAIESRIAPLHQSENAKYFYQLGYAYYHLEKYDKAFQTWTKANYGAYKNKIEEFSPVRYALLAESYAGIREFNEAKAYAEKTIKINPENSSAYFTLANIKANKATQEVNQPLELYYKAAQYEKNVQRSAEIYEKIAQLEIANDNYEKALQAVENGLTFNVGSKTLLYMKGLSLFHLHKYPEAASILQKFLSKTRDQNEHSKCMFLLGLTYRNGGKMDLARRAFANVKARPYKIAAIQEIKLMENQ